MPEVRIVHRDAVEVNRRRGGELRVLLSPRTVEATAGFMGVVTLQPGEVIREHYHPYSEELLYVTAGEMQLTVAGESYRLRAAEAILIPREARHRLCNDGDRPCEAVFCCSPLAPRPELGHVETEAAP